jgi:hypothetical protein
MTKLTKEATNDAVLAALLTADDNVEKDVFMKRFGVDFRIKAMSIKQIKRMQMQSTHVVGKSEVLDEEYFASLMVAEATVNVDWRNPQLLEKYNALEAAEVVSARLLSGEIASLSAEIMAVSGFNQDERVNSVKN